MASRNRERDRLRGMIIVSEIPTDDHHQEDSSALEVHDLAEDEKMYVMSLG